MTKRLTYEELACLRQRLYRVMWSSMALTQSTIKILESVTIHLTQPSHGDVADVTDRLHEVFNSYSFLTRVTLWQEIDDDELA